MTPWVGTGFITASIYVQATKTVISKNRWFFEDFYE